MAGANASTSQPATSSETTARPASTDAFRKSSELVIAFSGPVGSGHRTVVELLEKELIGEGYRVFRIKVSELIEDAIAKKSLTDFEGADHNNRYLRLQSAGNELRKRYGERILAELAVARIAATRNIEAGEEGDLASSSTPSIPDQKFAFLVDQLKHPAEARCLKDVYGNISYLIGVFANEKQREQALIESGLGTAKSARAVMDRDKHEEIAHGQKLDKTLHLADYFIRNSDQLQNLEEHVKRFVRLIHGYQVISPTADEYAMYVAFSAGLRSACLSRQVGAAVADPSGNIIATGCNDVPRPEGGLYTVADGKHDYRCFQRRGICYNDHHKARLEEEVLDEVVKVLSKIQDEGNLELKISVAEIAKKIGNSIRSFTKIKDLIEFSRSVHAEMDALISLARVGGSASKGATLYCTVFPCHSCARHIIAAGISRVVFIEPYPKSLAARLHNDALSVDGVDSLQPEEGVDGKMLERTRFIHFEGVAPTKYSLFFTPANDRKKDGKLVQRPAETVLAEYFDAYTTIEAKLVKNMTSQGVI